MSVVQAIVLGIVQGLSEFLPISSSAHLILVPWLFGWEDPGLAFDVALHWGTLVAVLVVFWRDWIRLVRAGIQSIRERRIADDPDRRLFWALMVSSIPAAIAGKLLNTWAEETLRAMHAGTSHVSGAALAAGLVASAVVGVIVIRWLLAWVRTRTYDVFVAYRLVVAVLIVALWISGKR